MTFDGENYDLESEKAVIATLLGDEGFELWVDVCDIIHSNSFIADTHQVVYKCINAIRQSSPDTKKINFPLLLSTSKTLNFGNFLEKKEEKEFLKEVGKCQTDKDNAKILAIKLKKFEIARLIREQLQISDTKLANITGDEKAADILAIAEGPILDLSRALHGFDNQNTTKMFENVETWLEDRLAHPNRFIGLKTGWEAFDKAAGGGIRFGTVAVVASRFGEGKSSAGDNIGFNVASQGYPVLILDSEMSIEERLPRDIAMISGVPITEIEDGSAALDPQKREAARKAAKLLKSMEHLYEYRSICGMEFDQIITVIKTWVLTKVGLDEEGNAKPALVILDYLKIQSSSDFSKNMMETQLMGMLVTGVVNICQKYKIACLTFAQVNREGLKSEESDAIATSDRIAWFCSVLVLMKFQSEEELDKQKQLGIKDLYDRKLILLKTRHGPGLDKGNYINLRFKRHICRMICGPSQWDLEKEVSSYAQSGEIVDVVESTDEDVTF